MMNLKRAIFSFAISVTCSSCATGLTPYQAQEYTSWEAKQWLHEEKNPTAATFLGLLPGGGSFYAREPALGVLNLLFWPLSIFWDPKSGYDGSRAINYYATKVRVEEAMRKEMRQLDDEFAAKKLTNVEYIREKHVIEDHYAVDHSVALDSHGRRKD